jgi:hypothetical protein
MAKPSQLIVLVEDNRQQQLVFRYLRRVGLEPHAMRFMPPSSGSGEQWVRERFPVEVTAYRRRNTHVETKLIAVIDADNLEFEQRLAQLDQKLQEAEVDLIREAEQVARLVPRRNDEETDYKRTRNDWADLIRPAAETLYVWTRPNAQTPELCIPSLGHGVAELRRLDFSRV